MLVGNFAGGIKESAVASKGYDEVRAVALVVVDDFASSFSGCAEELLGSSLTVG